MAMSNRFTKKVLASLVLSFFVASLFSPRAGFCSVGAGAPDASRLVSLSAPQACPVLVGLKLHPDNPQKIDFIFDTAGKAKIDDAQASRLINYFLAGLTIPTKDLWVNLSPYEQERIVPNSLGVTELGKDMLTQDYFLKQLSASLTYPETQTGKAYWQQAEMSKDAVNTFNKIWITPGKAEVYEGSNTVLITKSSLKAMMESDYLAMQENGVGTRHVSSAITTAMREKILPQIEKDINNGSNFATLRQAYNSMILAVWFKEKFEQSFFKYYLNQAKVKGIDLANKNIKDSIWAQYVQAFKAGAYNYIKEQRTGTRISKRQYFSGGATAVPLGNPGAIGETSNPDVADAALAGHVLEVRESMLDPQGGATNIAKEVIQRGNLLSVLAGNAINVLPAELEAAVGRAIAEGAADLPTTLGVVKLQRQGQALTISFYPSSGDKLFGFEKTVALEESFLSNHESGLPTQGIEFKPTKVRYDLADKSKPLMPHGYFEQFATRTSEEAVAAVRKAAEQGIEVSVSGDARGVDGDGSSQDLPGWQDVLTPAGITNPADLPATSTTTTHFPIKLRIEALPADRSDEIEYVAEDYGFTAANPLIVRGDATLEGGHTDQAHAPAYIFRNLFGLRGFRIICEPVNPMVIAGGLESSNVVNMGLIAAASMLRGANLSFADIFAAAVRIENNDLHGLTGGQGHGSVILGGANLLIWTSGIKGPDGKLVNNYSFLAVPLLDEAGMQAFENHMMLVQAGKGFVDGKAVIPRTAELVNNMWTFVLEAAKGDHELMTKLFTAQVALNKLWLKACKERDFETLGRIVDELAALRNKVEAKFINLALDYKNGVAGLPACARTFHDLIFDPAFKIEGVSYYDCFKTVRDFIASRGEQWMRDTRLYDLAPISDLAQQARAEGIYMMPLGAGGPGANLVAISAEGAEHIKNFLQRQGMSEINAEEAQHLITNDPAYAAKEYVRRTNLLRNLMTRDSTLDVTSEQLEGAVAQAIEKGAARITLSRGVLMIRRNYTIGKKVDGQSVPLDQQDRSFTVTYNPSEAVGRLNTFEIKFDAGLTMRGFSPLKIGREPMQFKGFTEMGMALPQGGQQVNLVNAVKHATSPVANMPVRGNIVVQSEDIKIGIDNDAGFSPRDVVVELDGKTHNLLTTEPGVGDPAFTMVPTVNRLDLKGEWVDPSGASHPYELTMAQAKAIQAKRRMLVLPGEPGPIHGLAAWAPWQVTHNPDGSTTGVTNTNIDGVPELFQGTEVAETHAAVSGRWEITDSLTNQTHETKPVGTGVHFWWNANPNGKTSEAGKIADRAKVEVNFDTDFAYATDPSKNGRWPTGEVIPTGTEAAKAKRFGFDQGQIIGDITPETIFDDVFHLRALPQGVSHHYVTIYDPITDTTKIIEADPEYNHVVVFTPFWEGANGALCVEVQTDPTNKFYLQKVARDNDDATLAEAAKGIVLLPHENKTLTMKVWLEAGKITVKDLQARELAAKASAASLVESASGTQDAANGGVSWNKIKVALNSKSGQFYFKRAFFTKDNLQGITVELNDQRTQKTIKQIIQEDGSAEN